MWFWIAIAIAVGIVGLVLAMRLLAARRELRRLIDAVPERPGAPAVAPAIPRAFEVLPKPSLHVDGDVRLATVNRLARQRFPHLQVGQLLLEAFGEHRLSDAVVEVLRTGTTARLQVQLFVDDRRTFRVVVEPVDTPAGGREALLFLTDLTEGIAYQELRSQFVANVSHELRTPITGLRGLLEALTDDEIDDDMRRRFADRAIAETLRLEALITDILFLSELEAVPHGADGEHSDLRHSVTAAVDLLGDLADEQAVTIECRLGDGGVQVELTDRLARTISLNLIENAIKYGGAGTHITVDLEIDEPGRASLRVADTGPGIDEVHLPHIFERFYRVDASRSKRMGGTGLGLSIVKHIVERAGGTIAAESRVGFGTTVTVTLPATSGDRDDIATGLGLPSDSTS